MVSTNKNNDIYDRLNSLKKKLDGIKIYKRWDNEYKEKIKIDFTYHSNKIEGNELNYSETINFLKKGIVPRGKKIKDILDIENHKKILDKIFENYEFKINENSIKDIHYELMKNKNQWDYENFYFPGKYKFRENYVVNKNEAIQKFISPENVSDEMKKMIKKYNYMNDRMSVDNKKYHPLNVSCYFQYEMVAKIHPFEDGNGRMGRILSNIVLMKTGFTPVVIDSKDSEKYLDVMEKASGGDSKSLVLYFGHKLENMMEDKIEKLLDYRKKKSQGNELNM